jgi:diguanylate cyclase (GGDEF)-like protein
LNRRYRISLAIRILVIFSALAAFSTGLALMVQDRTLAGDLHKASLSRLEDAADSTSLLITSHLEALQERYRAISGTPQFRATLELGDEATLGFYASQLAKREGAAMIAFLDASRRPLAYWSDGISLDVLAAPTGPGLVSHRGEPLALTVVALRTDDLHIGELVAVERIDDALVLRWTDLCGSDVFFTTPGDTRVDAVERVVRAFPDLELRVAVLVEAEREALLHSRYNLLTAGAVALILAFGISVVMSRNLVRPILQIQNATVEIGEGNFSGRLRSRRGDEIGDVARAVDSMLDRLGAYHEQVEIQRTALEENVEVLERSQAQLANAQRLARIGSWHFDMASRELWGSEEFRAIFVIESDDKPIDVKMVLGRVHAMDRAGLESAIYACVSEGATLRLDCRITLEEPSERILHIQAQLHLDDAGQPLRLEGTVQDVTDRKRSEEQIRYLAYHDSLTGLGNRIHCRERLELHLTQARRGGQIVGVICVGLDRFKRINDTLGQPVGDALLKGVADRLVDCLRESDVVRQKPGSSAISRHGGDEFSVTVTQLSDVQGLAKISARILEALSTPFKLGAHEVVISASIGLGAFPHDGDDVESLLKNANAAMYHAKEQGRNNYQFYAESMNEIALRRLVVESKLRRALDADEFELFYQPKVSLETGRITSVEALIRWNDPETGFVLPGVFIPIAEETGLIVPLGDFVLQTACRQIADWSARGIRLPISVNLSNEQFRAGDLAEKVQAVLAECGADASLLELEITESALMHDENAVVADLERLRALGIRVSIDDFGTGYSSFAYLRRLPVDALKIDRSFVMEIADNPEDAALAASIVTMGKALKLLTIAEGVETVAQRDLLRDWGCDEMQGFLFSRAVPAEDLEEMVARESTREA